jgi:hypothetical protein
MRAPVLVLAMWLGSFQALAADNERPTGTNCDLSTPPASAGEDSNHGITLRIYPRAKDINASYTGCQLYFMPDAGKWVVVAITEIVGGDPVRVWSEHDPSRLACRYKNGKVVQGDPEACPIPESLLMKSMGPGCVEIVRAAVAKHGLGAPRSRECEYE